MSTCRDCGAWFDPPAHYPGATRCLPCWRTRETKRATAEHDAAQWRAAALAARADADGLREQVDALRHEVAALRREVTAPRGIEPDMLRLLIHLAHPDKHGGSPAATRATAWLLQWRKAA